MNFEAINTLRKLPLAELMARALAVKLENRRQNISFCSIINAKSGRCSEDCKYCAQSAHYRTAAPEYPLLAAEDILAAAREAKNIGAGRFSLVASGKGLTDGEVERAADIIRRIIDSVGIQVCASFGILSEAQFARLRQAGLSRYHHNLETSREYFPKVTTTHSFDDRVRTVQAAQAAGLEVCSGGIFGLGESEDDRLSMAAVLKDLAVDSIPINILIPLPGTPMEKATGLGVAEILRSIALYRLMHPTLPIRLAAGRESALRDFLAMAFMAGADGLMIGGYLTQKGRPPEDDQEFAKAIRQFWTDTNSGL